ncbi:zinc finger CCCH domain-containing protein 9-like isoform X2 [Canna indica]|uniref:Zinc finger CCCH domain-containing protein 9-like isoform X2 n=1 Tax=Canna indica TaxID=4628 RepID=A0AAQ3Q1I0_9LILI|nr:zinc finger CCCH domain-containing protein 9-like isoform X2 [Canna indica]
MQQEIISAKNGDSFSSSISSPQFVSLDRLPLSPSYLNNGVDLSSLYAMFSPQEDAASHNLTPLLSAPGPVPISLPMVSFDDSQAAATEDRLFIARLYQEIAERYDVCLSQLRDAVEEVASLRRENANLRAANSELARQLALFTGKPAVRFPPSAESALTDELRRLSVAESPHPEESPTSVLAFQESGSGSHHRFARQPVAEKRVPLPKSISIRSSGYLKVNQTGGAASAANRNGRFRASNPSMVSSQRVYVGGEGSSNKKGEREGEEEKESGEGGDGGGALELEVYHQGMFKTELCNKWEESGECPYGDHCQFAHGIAELRPVLRHPRYKTELCRMVLFGDSCPYGHRCHFRHSLSPSEHQRLLLRP